MFKLQNGGPHRLRPWRCLGGRFRSFSIDSDDLQLFYFVEQVESCRDEADNLDQFFERHSLNRVADRSERGQFVRK